MFCRETEKVKNIFSSGGMYIFAGTGTYAEIFQVSGKKNNTTHHIKRC